jgi:hypothetical protein
MHQAGFKLATPVSDRRQNYASDRAATGIDPRTVQPVESRYTDWATEAPKHIFTLPEIQGRLLRSPFRSVVTTPTET